MAQAFNLWRGSEMKKNITKYWCTFTFSPHLPLNVAQWTVCAHDVHKQKRVHTAQDKEKAEFWIAQVLLFKFLSGCSTGDIWNVTFSETKCETNPLFKCLKELKSFTESSLSYSAIWQFSMIHYCIIPSDSIFFLFPLLLLLNRVKTQGEKTNSWSAFLAGSESLI